MSFAALYLHGLASSPDSTKARFFAGHLSAKGLPVTVPDLNKPSFYGLTTRRAVEASCAHLDAGPRHWFLFGSSFGGRVATRVAAARPDRVIALILFAPAFEFCANWERNLGRDTLETWRRSGQLLLDHPAYGRQMPLGAGFLEDAEADDGSPPLPGPIPTLIFHGTRDDVIHIDGSRRFVEANPHAQLVELDADHQLLGPTSQLDRMWDEILPLVEGLRHTSIQYR